MASIILGSIAAAAGPAIGAPFANFIASPLAKLAGDSLIGAITSKPQKRHTQGARLEDLIIQTSTFGKGIASFFGTVRLAGNVIWALPIKEIATTSTVQTGGKGGRSSARTVSQTSFSYFVTLAIAVGEGPVTRVERVWADAKQLDLGQGIYRTYHGDETQMPDSLIESIEGVGKTPAYRGMAYVVIEDFPLASFGNRIPNFTFEVTRNATTSTQNETRLEEQIDSVVLLPGSGEYVYDTVIASKTDGVDINGSFAQQGYRRVINANTANGKADALVALDQMKDALPNVQWVALTVNWFADDLDIANADIYPAVEFNTASNVTPNAWNVAGFTRQTARVIGSENGRPRYGGTPDDDSVVRLAAELKSRGYNVFFYPLMLMDMTAKPWRGDIGGDSAQVNNFFTKNAGYKNFILHYANLLKDKVDAFSIGSELKALTAITDMPGNYPAVNELITLAGEVKTIMGAATKTLYAADWSEYHHTNGGWYHLDPLWASPNIDVIGIDAYFPLTDKPQLSISQQDIIDGWTSGEGYDWVYQDAARTIQVPVAQEYAWKNIAWWWQNTHINPDAVQTPWVAQSKPIWFSEIGYASVDGTSNEPNVFIDPTTNSSAYPRFSRERIDFVAQRQALEAAQSVWQNSAMIPQRFVWAWDMRPYPAWPDLLDVWADGANWITGHWIQGKLGATQLKAIVAHLLLRAGLLESQFDVSALSGQVDGLVINERSIVRAVLEQLQIAYAFDLKESGGKIVAITRNQQSVLDIQTSALIAFEGEEPQAFIEYQRQEELELPKRVELRYLDRFEDYTTSVQAAERETRQARDTQVVSLSLALADSTAKSLADRLLYERWLARDSWQFQLPLRYAYLEPGDVITMQDAQYSIPLQIQQLQMGKPGMLRVKALLHEASIYDQYIAPRVRSADVPLLLAPSVFHALDLPALPGEAADLQGVKLALNGTQSGWPGAVILRESIIDASREVLLSHNLPAIMGTSTTALADADGANILDETSSVEIALLGEGSLQNITQDLLLNGANAALIGNEIIQFSTVEIIAEQQVRLRQLLRGRLGTQWASRNHQQGERFILLDGNLRDMALNTQSIGQQVKLLAVTSGLTEQDAVTQDFTYEARALLPYAPVHLKARKLGNGDVAFSWIRRSRMNGEWRDFVDVPLNETVESYDIEILQNNIIKHATSSNSPSFTYSLTDQISDLGQALGVGDLRVWQVSTLVGRGYMASALFDVG
jgi:hypothetical protein